eukprot:XP_005633868.1 transcription initiation factor TFIID subunit 4-like [Canis lupus familiaris]
MTGMAVPQSATPSNPQPPTSAVGCGAAGGAENWKRHNVWGPGRAGRAKADGPLHGDASGGPARTENSVQAGPAAPSSARRPRRGGRGRGPRLRAFVDRRPPAPARRRRPGPGAAETPEHRRGPRASGLGPPGTRAALSPARPRRAPRAAVGARRAASAPGTHLGHHLLELALRHRHGGRLATPVTAGRGSAAPGPPQAAPHSHTPRSRPPTPPPLATGSRPPGRLFRFRYVTSGASGGGRERRGRRAVARPSARIPGVGGARREGRSLAMGGPGADPPGSPSSRSEPPCGTKHDAPAWASLRTCAAACPLASPRPWGAGSSSGPPRTEQEWVLDGHGVCRPCTFLAAVYRQSLSLPPPVLGAHRVGQGAVKPGFEDMKCDRLHDVS